MRRLLTDARKAGVAVVGAAADVLALGVLPDPYAKWCAVIVSIGTALGVYNVRNKGKAPRA